MTLAVGERGPNFVLKDKDGAWQALEKLPGNFIVVYFYPKDNTPGCTLEAEEFNKTLDRFGRINATIIGISGGDEHTKTMFCEQHKLKFTLVSDTDFSVAKRYGAYGDKVFMGKKYQGILRTTFILDKNRMIIKVFENVKPQGHAEEVLAFLKGYGK